jgi:hypothetical protein
MMIYIDVYVRMQIMLHTYANKFTYARSKIYIRTQQNLYTHAAIAANVCNYQLQITNYKLR